MKVSLLQDCCDVRTVMLVVKVPEFWKHRAIEEGVVELNPFIEEVFKSIHDEVTMGLLCQLHLTGNLVVVVVVPFEAKNVAVPDSLQEAEVLSCFWQNFALLPLIGAFDFNDGILSLDKGIWRCTKKGVLWVNTEATFYHPFASDLGELFQSLRLICAPMPYCWYMHEVGRIIHVMAELFYIAAVRQFADGTEMGCRQPPLSL